MNETDKEENSDKEVLAVLKELMECTRLISEKLESIGKSKDK